MKTFKLIVLFWLSMTFNACSVSYTSSLVRQNMSELGLKDHHNYQRMASWRIDSKSKVGLQLADPDNALLPRTARQLNKMLIAEFNGHFPNYAVVSGDSLNDTLLRSFGLRCELLIVASLIDAKNNLNTRSELLMGHDHYPEKEWGRDQLVLQFKVYETQTGELLDVITLKSKAAYFKRDDTIALNLIEDSLRHFLSDITYIQHNS